MRTTGGSDCRRIPLFFSASATLIAITTFLILLPLLFDYQHLRQGLFTSGDVRLLFPANSRSLEQLNSIEHRFGDDLADVVILRTEGIEADEEFFQQLSDDLTSLEGVRAVMTPQRVPAGTNAPFRFFDSTGALARVVISVAGSLAEDERERLDSGINEVLTKISERKPIRSGVFSASEAATRAIKRETKTFVPLCVLALVLLVRLLFGSWSVALRVLLAPALTLFWLFGVMYLSKTALNPVTQLVPPLLSAIATSYSVYIGARAVHESFLWDARSFKAIAISLFCASITTIAGFASLVFFETVAISEFGLIMAGGTAVAALMAMIVTTILLRDAATRYPVAATNFDRYQNLRCYRLKDRTICFGTLFALLAGLGVFYLEVDTSPIHFLPRMSAERLQIEQAAQLFPGNHLLSVALTPKGRNLQQSDLETVGLIAAKLRDLGSVAGVTSAHGFSQTAIKAGELELDSLSFRTEIERIWGPPAVTAPDLQSTRLLIETDAEGKALIDLVTRVKQQLADIGLLAPLTLSDSSSSWAVAVSSRELVMAEQSEAVVTGVVDSLGSTLLLVIVLLAGTFRSLKIVVASLLPNLLPILCIFGLLGLTARELNLGAAMVAAAALGMVSDYTFHILVLWRGLIRLGEPVKVGESLEHQKLEHITLAESALVMSERKALTALDLAQQRSGGPFFVTGVILTGGFLVLAFSDVMPVRQFGVLMVASMILGTAGNLFLLPMIVRWLRAF